MNEKKIVSVIGGTGFIGKYLVDLLLNKGYYVKIISRNSKSKKIFFPSSKLGQFSLLDCNIVDKKRLSHCIKGSKYVINLVGLLEPKGENTFKNAHCVGAKNLATLCIEQNIEKLIHVSALGVDKNKSSSYAKTKLEAEKNIKKNKKSLIIRPSIVCGEEDNFINFFAKYAKFSPFLPLIGGGKTKFQPISVIDLVNIILHCFDKNFKSGKILEVGGPDVLSFKEILEYIISELNLKRVMLSVSFNMARKIAFITEKLPISILTRDQVEMLKTDNIVEKNKSYNKFITHQANSFYIFAEKQLQKYKKGAGHIS